MPTAQYIENASIKNLYNAWKGSTGNPTTTASLAGISARTSGQISLGKDFLATGMSFTSASYSYSINTNGVQAGWLLLGTGTYVQRLKKGHSFTTYSDDIGVIQPTQFGVPINDTMTTWDTADEGSVYIYLAVAGYINTWVGGSWTDVSATANVANF